LTTPIYYVNGQPHIGHAYTTIAADTLARFKRLEGYDVHFLTGTDEHGQKIARTAEGLGQTPQAYVDGIVASFKKMWQQLDISYDDFIRTTEERHQKVVQKVFQRLLDQDDIYLGTYEGWYCTPCESFWQEGQLLEGSLCPDCKRPVEWVREECYFFRLSKYQKPLLDFFSQHPEFLRPESRRNEMLNFIAGGLEDLCVSRTTFTWGVPVLNAPGHVVYVWLDALINYISALGAFTDEDSLYKKYWPADLHLVGKEIVRFHTVIWPAVLMALDLPLPKRVFGHGWWTVEGEKMSKSRGNVVDPGQMAKEYGSDAIRYFLLREVPFGADGDFSNNAFIARINSDLANDLGNLLSRTTAMIDKFQGGRVLPPGVETEFDQELIRECSEGAKAVGSAVDNLAFHQALEQIWRGINAANKYIENTAPWTLAKEHSPKLATVFYNLAEALRITAVLLVPFLPNLPRKIWEQLGIETPLAAQSYLDACTWGLFPAQTVIRRGEPIFPRIEDEKKEKAKMETAPAKQAELPENVIGIEDFAKTQLKVGKVISAEKVEGADKLLSLKVDLGPDDERQIVAGVAKYYLPQDLIGKLVVVVANLKPAKLRGITSEGMLLAASTAGKTQLALLTVDSPLPPGSRIS
jgi:methionyl-tRNA synthetase